MGKKQDFAALELICKNAWVKTAKASADSLKSWQELGNALKAVRAEFPDNKAFGQWREKTLPDLSNQNVSYAMQFSNKLENDSAFAKAMKDGAFKGIGQPKNAIAKYNLANKSKGEPREQSGKVVKLEDAMTMLATALPILIKAAQGGNDQAKSRLLVAYEAIEVALNDEETEEKAA